jgi:bile acid:Na+ symporter, BASS family
VIGLLRTAAILLAMTLGALIPEAHGLAWLIRWLVMTMLFLVFMQVRLSPKAMRRSHWGLLAANVGLGFGAWALGWIIGGRDIALAAFFAGITPTAIAAPVIISFLRGRVEYVVAAFLLTNVVIAALLPVVLPLVLGQPTPEAFGRVTRSVGVVVFFPMASAWLVRSWHPRASEWPARLRNVSFAMWIFTMFLITANASEFLRRNADTPHVVLAQIGVASLLVCATSFAAGWLIGGREFAREASQALGQKNTAFTIYLALTYASPVVALGPTCYVIWHNLWNSWQLHRASIRPIPDPK